MNSETNTITKDIETETDRTETAPEQMLADPTSGLASVNDVHLIGRLTTAAADRELPSGDVLTTFRVVVDRPGRSKAAGRFDVLDCHTWSGRVRRSAQTWRLGDTVELRGSIRRRFFRTAGRLQSMTEVEVVSARIVRRQATG